MADRGKTASAKAGKSANGGQPWAVELYGVLKAAGVGQMSFVPDAGHASLIELIKADNEIVTNVCSTEEEGIAIAAGAWLGGKRSVVLMQSSGVGNCINTLSLSTMGRFPLLLLVTMRGEWAEFNPWQVPMGRATASTLEAVGITTMRADMPEDVIALTGSAARLAFEADQQCAVLLSQRLLGAKKW